MLKREIKYTDFNGEEQIDTCYFNLSKPELIEMQFENEGGLTNFLQKIIDEKDGKKILEKLKEFILMGYGEKSVDGKRFVKSDEIREAFSQSAAYEALYIELLTDSNAAGEFIAAIVPKDLEEFKQKLQEQDKPEAPPAVTN